MEAVWGGGDEGVAAGGLGIEAEVDARGFSSGFGGGGDGKSLAGEGTIQGDEGVGFGN